MKHENRINYGINILIDYLMVKKKSERLIEYRSEMQIFTNRFGVLLGHSGCGKSTLIRFILEINQESLVANGKICFFENEMELTLNECKRRGLIGFLTSESSMVPWKDVKKNLYLPQNLNNGLFKTNEGIILEELNKLNLNKEDLKKYPDELSTGMLHRFLILKLLLYEPKFLFLDEFLTGLDSDNCEIITKYVKDYLIEKDAVCLAITHNAFIAQKYSDVIFKFDNKTIKQINKL